MASEKSARRLGRGLDAIFEPPSSTSSPDKSATEESPLKEIPVGDIVSNPFQPRKAFSPVELRELAESISSNGLLQPITVRRASSGGSGFELIAGERRLRAATSIGWTKIPALVRPMGDQELLTLALVENLQRADLNPIEEAEGYSQLISRFGHTQQMVATMVGKDRSTVANVVRILQLPPSVKKLLQDGTLTPGQARPLLALNSEPRIAELAREIAAHGLSAREVERRVKADIPHQAAGGGRKQRKNDTRSPEVKRIEQDLRKKFQTDVTIVMQSETKGSISLSFYSPDDLARLLEVMGV